MVLPPPPRRLLVGWDLRQWRARRVFQYIVSRPERMCDSSRPESRSAKQATCPAQRHQEMTSALSHLSHLAVASTRSRHVVVRLKYALISSSHRGYRHNARRIIRNCIDLASRICCCFHRRVAAHQFNTGNTDKCSMRTFSTAWPRTRQKFRRMWHADQ